MTLRTGFYDKCSWQLEGTAEALPWVLPDDNAAPFLAWILAGYQQAFMTRLALCSWLCWQL